MNQRFKKLVKGWIISPLDRYHNFLLSHPIFTGITIAITYFLLEMYMAVNVSELFMYMGIGLTLMFLYVCYIHQIRNNKRAVWGFVFMTVLTILLMISYNNTIGLLPNISDNYFKSQIILIVLIAPIMEELAFRHFLYGKWARNRFGTKIGMVITGILFILCHPITNVEGFALYWLPTIFLYLVYHNYGLYAAIIAHMIYNMLTLM